MTKSSIEVRTCDRCGHRAELRRPDQEYDWAQITARQVNGPFRVGRDGAADLCPACTRLLNDWWDAGQKPVRAAS